MSKQRKFYFISDDFSINPPGLILENEEQLTPIGQKIFIIADPRIRGFYRYTEIPRFRYVKKEGRMPKDLEKFSSYWIISSKAKIVFENIARDAFEFVECELLMEQGTEKHTVWLCDVLPIIDAVDDDRSNIKIINNIGEKEYHISWGSTTILFNLNVVNDYRIFRLKFIEYIIICDDLFKDACKAANLKGIRFLRTDKPGC